MQMSHIAVLLALSGFALLEVSGAELRASKTSKQPSPAQLLAEAENLDQLEAQLQPPVDVQEDLRPHKRAALTATRANEDEISTADDASLDELSDVAPDLSPPLMDKDRPGSVYVSRPTDPETGEEVPKYHPLVKRALDTMEEPLHALADQRKAVAKEHDTVADDSFQVVDQETEAETYRRKLVKEEVALKQMKKQVEQLKAEEAHIKKQHDRLAGKLHDISEKRLRSINLHLSKRKSILDKSEEQLDKWTHTEQNYKDTALEALKERRMSKEALQKADEDLEEAEKRQKEAHNEFIVSRREAAQEVEAYQYVQTHYKAVKAQEELDQEKYDAQERSLAKMQHVFDMEGARVEDALTASKAKLNLRLEHAEEAEAKANSTVSQLKHDFAKWQAEEKQKLEDAHAHRSEYDSMLNNYNNKRKQVFDSAEAQAVQRARRADDWAEDDDWAWHGEAMPDDSDDGADSA